MSRRGRFGVLSRALANVDRYRRLNFAVVGCLVVNVTLVLALVGAVRVLDQMSQEKLGESYDHHETGRELLQAAAAFERLVEGVPDAAGSLAALRDTLAARADALTDSHEAERIELDHLLGKIDVAIDSEGGVVPASASPGTTIRRLELLADRFVQEAEIVLGQVAPTPWVAAGAARALVGQPISEHTAAAAGIEAVAGAMSLSDNEYKIQLAQVAVKRAILRAAGIETGGLDRPMPGRPADQRPADQQETPYV